MKQLLSTVAFGILSTSVYAGQFVPAEQSALKDQYIVVLNQEMPNAKARTQTL
jgi:hypothetical protein